MPIGISESSLKSAIGVSIVSRIVDKDISGEVPRVFRFRKFATDRFKRSVRFGVVPFEESKGLVIYHAGLFRAGLFFEIQYCFENQNLLQSELQILLSLRYAFKG